jgi:hypothetical protein
MIDSNTLEHDVIRKRFALFGIMLWQAIVRRLADAAQRLNTLHG